MNSVRRQIKVVITPHPENENINQPFLCYRNDGVRIAVVANFENRAVVVQESNRGLGI